MFNRLNKLSSCPADPFALKRNVARSLNSQMVFEYIQERFRTAYRYFACPQSRNGHAPRRNALRPSAPRPTGTRPIDTKSGEGEDANSTDEDEDEEEDEDDDDEDDAGDVERHVSRNLSRLLVEDEDNDGLRHSSPTPSPHNGLFPDSEDEEQDEEGRKGPEQDAIAPEDLHYIFDRMIFTGGKVDKIILPNRCCIKMFILQCCRVLHSDWSDGPCLLRIVIW